MQLSLLEFIFGLDAAAIILLSFIIGIILILESGYKAAQKDAYDYDPEEAAKLRSPSKN